MKRTGKVKRRLEEVFIKLRKVQRVAEGDASKRTLTHVSHVNIWREDDGPGDSDLGSGSLSSGISKISGSSDSVSNVSSDDFSLMSLEEGEVEDQVAHADDYGNLINNKLDDVVDIEKHISSSKEDARRIKMLRRILATGRAVMDTYVQGLNLLQHCHKTTCMLLSIRVMLVNANKESLYIKRINECFSKQYDALSSLYEIVLNLGDDHGQKYIVSFAPYCLDILLSTFPTLEGIYKESRTWDDVHTHLQSLIHSTLLICCCWSEYAEEEVRVSTVRSIYYLMKVLLPIDRMLSFASTNDLATDVYKAHLNHLFEITMKEYMMETFKPSYLYLLHLKRNIGMYRTGKKGAPNDSSNLNPLALNHLLVAIRAGCQKRQFPVGYMDSHHYNCKNVEKALKNTDVRKDTDSSGTEIGRLWSRINYWLLLLLEDNSISVRNMALKIVKHILVTTEFIEKNRQHILALVSDCLSDSTTFDNAMAVLVAISYIYPLKDGAVRRISNLTLKGRDIKDRVGVIRMLGKCNFANKGIESFLNIVQTLCDPVASDEQRSPNAQWATSSIMNHSSDVLFSRYEWSAILQALRMLKENIAYKSFSRTSTEPGTILHQDNEETNWIRLLWAYMLQNDVESHIKYLFCTSEAVLRFPLDVPMHPSEAVSDFVTEADETVSRFLHIEHSPVKDDHLKGKQLFQHIHQYRIGGGVTTIRSLKDRYHKKSRSVLTREGGKKCSCVDCAMDKLILSPKAKRVAMYITNDAACTSHALSSQSRASESSKDSFIDEGVVTKIHVGEAVFGYYHKFMRGTIEEYENIDDVYCSSFPSHLGVSVRSKLPLRSKDRNVVGWMVRNLRFMKSSPGAPERRDIAHCSSISEYRALKIHVTHPLPTIYPTSIELVPLMCKGIQPLVSEGKRTLWLHSKRVVG